MRRLLIILPLLALCACMPKPLTLVPIDTLVAQTMAAIPRTATNTNTPTEAPSPTSTFDLSTATPGIDLNIPGAYCIPTNTQRKQALVTKILDAASIEVVTATETFRVRYIGLDAPKITPILEWQGPQAVAANERMVGGKYVTLVQDVTDMDGTGYFPRYVILGGTFVNHELIRLGFSKTVASPPDISCENSFLSAQVEAQGIQAGLWSSTPVPTFTITLTPTITNTPRPATATSERICYCEYSPFSCSQFRTHAQAQSCYNYCRKLGYKHVFPDNNNNGIVCEGLP
jgi:endonuclease YncB( thermonuclease family)